MLDAVEMRHQRYAVIAAVCATAILAIALVNRISLSGPCAFNGFQRSAVCVQPLPLPAAVPDNTQILRIRADAEPEASPMRTLERFNFSLLRQLRELTLVRCGVEELAPDTFSFVPHLRRLDLRHNRIQNVSGNQFRGIADLEYLLLSDNRLTELGDDAFRGLTIGRLELANNPSLRRVADTAFHSARIVTLVMVGCGLERLTRAAMRDVAESLRELIVANNTRPLSLDADLFDGFHLRRLVLVKDQLSDAGFLAGGDHDEIVLDGNEQLWSGGASTVTAADRKRTRKLSLRCGERMTWGVAYRSRDSYRPIRIYIVQPACLEVTSIPGPAFIRYCRLASDDRRPEEDPQTYCGSVSE